MKQLICILWFASSALGAQAQLLDFYDLLTMRNEGPKATESLLTSKGWYIKSDTTNDAEGSITLLFGFGNPNQPSPAWLTYQYGEEFAVNVQYHTTIKKHFELMLTRLRTDGLRPIKQQHDQSVDLIDFESSSFVVRTIVFHAPEKPQYVVKVYAPDAYRIAAMREAIEPPKQP